ncbi:uncharacterized protein M437DRAFT_80025 [Aureobasidium melanogenum CBS 110374]|uniref:Uncharacterized protein n=1 Tax=Aureobasidium melanogenum (strain CBS 110374) TaxID=1043003 RepID=A0A074WBT4_AURM1|nr:uncharacterized protein M437DRAFT_80025 [Aureobasidium melanogenum CBS 110374]KEQ67377.1 hypothetical protein M437DRAFT_80025 [Aureobasidium melanogenum CBS 110374]
MFQPYDENHDTDNYSNSPMSDNSNPEDFDGIEDLKDQHNLHNEPTFHLEDTTALSHVDVTKSSELDQSLLSYGTNFEQLANKDPVYKRILQIVQEYATEPDTIVYAKVNSVKLATINEAKASNLVDAELSSMMEAVGLAQRCKTARRNAQNKEEEIIRDCIDQIHWLNRKRRLQHKVAGMLRAIIKASDYTIPGNVKRVQIDDLFGFLYAITSDIYYKDTLLAATTQNMPSNGHVTATNSDSKTESRPLKHIPHAGSRFGINLITHLTLVGGLPMHVEKFYTTDKATFSEVMRKISSSLESSQSHHRKRLGFLTQNQRKHGNWLFQIAPDFESLNLGYAAWKIFDAPSLKLMPTVQEKQVFMIHEYHLSMPARIKEKVRSSPRLWNTWSLLDSPTLTSPPAPEFVPCYNDMIVAPFEMEMTALRSALPNPQAKTRTAEQQKAGKKERRKKRVRQKKNKGKNKDISKPATFQLAFR